MALILVKSFNTPHEAYLYKGKLEMAGIQCFLHDENSVGLELGYSIALGGIKLMINEEDKDLALQILQQEAQHVSDKAPKKKPNFNIFSWLRNILKL